MKKKVIYPVAMGVMVITWYNWRAFISRQTFKTLRLFVSRHGLPGIRIHLILPSDYTPNISLIKLHEQPQVRFP